VTTPLPVQKPSTLRAIIGVVCMASSLVIIAASFVLFVRALDASGYGSPAWKSALMWMSGGGGLLGVGMAVLIWELSVRYNIRH
jgi:hypothetical protein